MKLSLRDLFWLILLIAVVLGWGVDRSHYTRDHNILLRLMPPAMREPVFFAWNKSLHKFPLRIFRIDEEGEVVVVFGSGTTSVGAGESVHLKKVGNNWQVLEQDDFDV